MYTKEEIWAIEDVQKDKSKFRLLPKELIKNIHVAKAAVKAYPDNLEYVSPELKDDLKFVTSAVKQKGSCLRYASENLRNNIELMELVLEGNFFMAVIQHASDEVRKNKKIALKAIDKDSNNYNHIDKSFKNDPDIIKRVLNKNSRMFSQIPNEDKNNVEYLELAYSGVINTEESDYIITHYHEMASKWKADNLDNSNKDAIFRMGDKIKEHPESFLKGKYLDIVNHCLDTNTIVSYDSHTLLGELGKSLVQNNNKDFFADFKKEIFDFLSLNIKEYYNLRHLPVQVKAVINHGFQSWTKNEVKEGLNLIQKDSEVLFTGLKELFEEELSRRKILDISFKKSNQNKFQNTRKIKI